MKRVQKLLATLFLSAWALAIVAVLISWYGTAPLFQPIRGYSWYFIFIGVTAIPVTLFGLIIVTVILAIHNKRNRA